MKFENLNLLAQTIDAMNSIAEELETALEKKDIARIKKSKEEILNFQMQLSKIIN